MKTISIVVPYHDIKETDFFLSRLQDSIEMQSFTDFEVILTKHGKMAENTNAGIRKAKGKLIKILFMDDYFAHENSLKDIVHNFVDEIDYLFTGTNTNPNPEPTEDIRMGNNKLGSPSALTMRNKFENNLLFDENMSWLLDCDYYHRIIQSGSKFGILPGVNVMLGIGEHQMTHTITDEQKLSEHQYMYKKYA